jgi:nucleotide-binding universal stress UspA family protein
MRKMTTEPRSILVAFDGSECSFSAVAYVGAQFSGMRGLKVTLFHVLPNVPPPFWDDGHILTETEKEERQRVIAKWLSNQKEVMNPLFERARQMLIEDGLAADQIGIKTDSELWGVAEAILEEARTSGYRTLVVGRCGFAHKEPLFMGSTATRIVNKGMGLAICVVG